MIFDARKVAKGEVLSADVCVVGAGAAGITLALELAKSSMSVIVLEAGGLTKSGKSQRLYVGSVSDLDRHLPPDKDRYRQLGGTTALWGGRCMPFDGIDFAHRDYVQHSGWPISRNQLEHYYRRAHVYCQCGRFAYNQAEALPDAIPEMISAFRDVDLVTTTIERWSPPTNFGKTYRSELARAKNASVFVNAVVLKLDVSADGGRVSHVIVRTIGGNCFRVTARAVVLAGGGLETARLLLVSTDVFPSGIGNHSGWLGRGYMCHLQGVISRVTIDSPRQVVFGYELDGDGVYCRRRLWIGEDAQRRLGILNMYALLDRALVGDPEHGNAILSLAFLAKLLVQRSSKGRIGHGKYALYWRHIRNILRGSPALVSFLPKYSRKRFLHERRVPSILVRPRSNNFCLYFHSEQSPNYDSRISLSRERDECGVPRLHIDHRVNELDVESVYRAHVLIGERLSLQGCGSLTFEQEDPRTHIKNCQATLGHHIGTTRMAQTPSQGVVDENCRVYGLANLFIAGSAVFPTSSQAHPTLTIVALAVRLADYLASNLEEL